MHFVLQRCESPPRNGLDVASFRPFPVHFPPSPLSIHTCPYFIQTKMRLEYNLLLLAAASVFSLPIVSKVALLASEETPAIRDDGERRDGHILGDAAASQSSSRKADASDSGNSDPSMLVPRKPGSSEPLPSKTRVGKKRPSRIEIREPEPEPAPQQCTTPPCVRSEEEEEEDPFELGMSVELLGPRQNGLLMRTIVT